MLSDQNPFTVKLAVYPSTDKTNFIDIKEFKGSILEIYDKTIDYLKLNSATYGIIKSSVRTDIEEYPEFILREILLNSLIHRDYSVLTSNIINIYKDSSIEFISYGSLYNDITIEDALAGLSTTRNPYLQSVFMRLKNVEAIGSGLRRVNSYYENIGLKLNVKSLPSSFIVKLPKIVVDNERLNNNTELTDEEKIINYLKENKTLKRSEAEKLIDKGKTATNIVLNKLVDNNMIIKIGSGPNTEYHIN